MTSRASLVARLPLERQEQALFFQWLEYVTINGERLRPHVYAVPNGGSRHPVEAARMSAEGVTPGVPDINVDVPALQFKGLRIEMKRRGEKATIAQLEQLALRKRMGYRSAVCEGFDEARTVTMLYLRQEWVVVDRWSN